MESTRKRWFHRLSGNKLVLPKIYNIRGFRGFGQELLLLKVRWFWVHWCHNNPPSILSFGFWNIYQLKTTPFGYWFYSFRPSKSILPSFFLKNSPGLNHLNHYVSHISWKLPWIGHTSWNFLVILVFYIIFLSNILNHAQLIRQFETNPIYHFLFSALLAPTGALY